MVKEALNCVVHHRKTILTKNEKMMIALAEDMARSTTDISDVLLERWLELRCCFSERDHHLFIFGKYSLPMVFFRLRLVE